MKALYLAVVLATTLFGPAFASSCGATNDVGDVCSIDCPTGQAAQCSNAAGAGSPSCACTGEQNFIEETFAPIKEISIQENETPAIDEALRSTDILTDINAKLSQAGDFNISQFCRDEIVGEACKQKKMVCGSGGRAEIMSRILTADEVNDRGDAFVSPQCYESICTNIYKQLCYPVTGKVTANNDMTAVGPVVATLDDHRFGGIPIWYHGLRGTYTNCNPAPQVMNFSHTTSLTVGAKVAKSNTLKNSQTISAKISASYEKVATAELGASFSKEVTVSDQAEESDQRLESFTYAEVVNIPPMHEVVYSHEWVERAVRIGFHGEATVDGTLVPNLAGMVRISDVLPNAADRTFKFSGYVEKTTVIEGIIKNHASKLTEEQCKSMQSGMAYEPYITKDVAKATE